LSEPVDGGHLERITHRDPQLQNELLALFHDHVPGELARLRGASAEERSAIAHRLAGSAKAIGAWEVARVAAELGASEEGIEATTAELAAAVAEVQRYIEARLSAAPGAG
jgi:HPt (histidine-containing phosphotransfer) domain-containing protein